MVMAVAGMLMCHQKWLIRSPRLVVLSIIGPVDAFRNPSLRKPGLYRGCANSRSTDDADRGGDRAKPLHLMSALI